MGTTASQLGKDLLSEYQVSDKSKAKICYMAKHNKWLKLTLRIVMIQDSQTWSVKSVRQQPFGSLSRTVFVIWGIISYNVRITL